MIYDVAIIGLRPAELILAKYLDNKDTINRFHSLFLRV